MYPNFLNDRISAGYSAEADLKTAHDADEIIKKTNQILKISKISIYVKNKVERFSPYGKKKKQVAVGVIGVGIFISTLLGPTTATAQPGLAPQTNTTSVVVVDQGTKFDEAQTLGIDGIDQANVVQTTELQEVVEVKSGDSPTPSGRPGGGSRRTPARQSRNPHVNPYRRAPNIKTNNPGNPDDSSENPDISEAPKRETVSQEFATPANFQPPKNRIITEEFKVSEDSEDCPADGEANEQKNSILKKLGKKTKKTLKNTQAKKDYNSVCRQIQNGQRLRDIGKGGRYFGRGVGYIRKGDTRIFYEEFVDNVKILGVTTKGDTKQLNQMAKLVEELYPFIDINYKDL